MLQMYSVHFKQGELGSGNHSAEVPSTSFALRDHTCTDTEMSSNSFATLRQPAARVLTAYVCICSCLDCLCLDARVLREPKLVHLSTTQAAVHLPHHKAVLTEQSSRESVRPLN